MNDTVQICRARAAEAASAHLQIKETMKDRRWNAANARAYDCYRLLSSRRRWHRLIVRELRGLSPGQTVLEVGAGTGFITEILARIGYRVVATDLSAAMLQRAEVNLRKAGLLECVRLLQKDAENLDLESETFDGVISRWVLWTLPRPRQALSEMVGRLRPGGRLVLIDGQHMAMSSMARLRSATTDFFLTGRPPGWRNESYKAMMDSLPRVDAPAVAAMLEELGLENVKSRRLSARESDGMVKNWLMGSAWQSYLVTGDKPAVGLGHTGYRHQ